MSDLIISTMPADGLAPLGSRASAGIVMAAMMIPYISEQHLKGYGIE